MIDKVKYRNGDEILPRLGFGLMRLPVLKDKSDTIDYEEGQKMVDYAMSHGANYFDTSWIYHDGKSEVFIGDMLKKYPRESYYLANKMSIWCVDGRENVAKMFEEQLKKCQTEYFDFYLMHSLNVDHWAKCNEYGVYEYLQQQKSLGRIKHLGFSFHDVPALLEEIVAAHSWDFAQIQLNYLDWEIYKSKEQYEILTNANIPVIVMEPIRGGALATLSDKAVAELKTYNSASSTAKWALRFVGGLENVFVTLSGMSNFAQMQENVATFTSFEALNSEELEVLERAKKLYLQAGGIPCSGCKYCIDCPIKIDIPLIFAMWNQNCMHKNDWSFLQSYDGLAEAHTADKCVNCQKCVKVCPQKINISEELKSISNYVVNLKKGN